MSICFLLCNRRLNLTAEQIKWADMLVPIGGDGTFLMAAGRASPMLAAPSQTPIVGFNSDPVRSEGRLMLPKQFSHDPRAAVRKIIDVKYSIHIAHAPTKLGRAIAPRNRI